MNTKEISERLEYLRGEIQAERMSLEELAELQSLAAYIDPGDVELLEAAGVPEDPEERSEFFQSNYHLLPEDVQNVLSDFNENEPDKYAECSRIIANLEQFGWTADFGLSGDLEGLKKL